VASRRHLSIIHLFWFSVPNTGVAAATVAFAATALPG
jgi:hypothetical protein